jgi:hypothetical protein
MLPVEESEVAVVPLIDYFFLHGLSEVIGVRLSHGLVIIENVWVVGCA